MFAQRRKDGQALMADIQINTLCIKTQGGGEVNISRSSGTVKLVNVRFRTTESGILGSQWPTIHSLDCNNNINLNSCKAENKTKSYKASVY